MNVLRRTKVATLLFSLAGLLLSGYLTYSNYFGHSCHQNPLSWMVSCGGPKRVLIFGQPTCVYGFFMFLAVAIVALVGIRKVSSVGITKALLVLGLLGTVTGMMRTFGALGTGDIASAASKITGGVAEALIATCCGLFIAVCCLLPYNYLNARADQAKQEIADASHALEILIAKSETENVRR